MSAVTAAAMMTYAGYAATAYTLFNAVSGAGKSGQPAVQAPTAPPVSQAAQTPEQNVFKGKRQGMPGGGADPTLLSGAGGVDSGSLTLGKATLLGS